MGNKFKTTELTPLYMSTETGIVEADAVSRNTLTDRQVRSALESLIDALRERKLEPMSAPGEASYREGQEADLVTTMIRLSWHDRLRGDPHATSETLIGVLRTILGSLETWTTPSPTSRGYLSYTTSFLRKLGVRVQVQSGSEMAELPEDPFVEVGEAWVLDHDAVARGAFLRQAAEMVRRGEGERVAEVAQILLAQVGPGAVAEELSRVAVAGQRGEMKELPG
jgi:hypothetical protein